MRKETTGTKLSEDELQELVASTDTGGRKSRGAGGQAPGSAVALFWSLFQVWIASPIPFILGFGVFNDTEARSDPPGLGGLSGLPGLPGAQVLAARPDPDPGLGDGRGGRLLRRLSLPLLRTSSRTRPNNPNTLDIVVAVVGMMMLLEATRRALGPPLMIVAMVFLAYTFGGQSMPGISPGRARASAPSPTTSGSPPRASSASRSGSRPASSSSSCSSAPCSTRPAPATISSRSPSRCWATYRGGPAKAAVVASAMTGLISGSSIANVVTTGTFTIPMMKRVGFSLREGRRGRGRLLGERPDHAAGHGGGRLPDGGVRRHLLLRGGHPRLPAGADLLYRAGLHRPPGSPEGEHAGPAATAASRRRLVR